ncbi:MAG: glutamate ligase domain-containing protein, partial [Bacteroidota bacterium]
LEEQAKKRTLHIFTFCYKDGADLRILKSELKNDHTVVFFSFAGKQYSYRLNGYGDHLVQTISGVVAAMHSMGVSLNDTCKHIGEFHLLSGRGRVEDISLMSQHGDNINITIMDDSYNAAPESMAYGIKAFTSNPYIKGRRWMVLGDMLELGSDSIEAHKRMNFAVENSSPYGVLLFGQFMSYLYQELLNKNNQLNKLMHYNDIDILCKDLYALLQDGDAVFIKGSRGQWASKGRMAKVIDYLKSMNQDDQDERLMA